MSEEEDSPGPIAAPIPLRVLLAVHDNDLVRVPFVHGLRLAFAARGELEVVDVRSSHERIEPLGVREYLEKWGMLEQGSSRSDVGAAGLRVKKITRQGNQRRMLKRRLRRHPHNLLVIGTSPREQKERLFSYSLAEYLAGYFRHTTLFLPSDARPFIDEATGTVALSRVLMPVENGASFLSALNGLRSLLAFFPDLTVEVLALHVGTSFPELVHFDHPQLRIREELRAGQVVPSIIEAADVFRADLVVMATNGRDTLSQKIVGSITEQVLRRSPCPILSVSIAR